MPPTRRRGPMPQASSFDLIREWRGSQARAFEELSYQLLKARAPSGATVVRAGNPDGGVEWYATLPDGSEHGWQAKHIHGLDALLGAMAASVRRVVADRPGLRHLTFVISTNLATSTRGGERKSQRQKYDEAVERWKRSIPGADVLTFDLIQESDLLDELAKPANRGRQWFWWNEPVLGDEWLRNRHREQAIAAGERYQPELQVELPIQRDLEALGYAASVTDEYDRLLKHVIAEAVDIGLDPKRARRGLVASMRRVLLSAKALRATAEQAVLSPAMATGTLDPLAAALASFVQTAEDAESLEFAIERQDREQTGESASMLSRYTTRYQFRELREAAVALQDWLSSPHGQALQTRLYFLHGAAGTGKTHLLLDAVDRALVDGRPAVFLTGGRFGRTDLWISLCDQLGLEPLGAEILLGAMDSAAEAASLSGSRFVVAVDALNDTTDGGFWRANLPALRAAVEQWPHVSLAVSCRDTYLELASDDRERSRFVARSHPGFAGRELEAAQRYFAHFGIEAPRVPLLLPEFTVPLFLRMYCEGAAGRPDKSTELGYEGRLRIFERYLEVKVAQVALRIRPSASSRYEAEQSRERVWAVLNAFLDECAARGREGLPRDLVQGLAAAAAGDDDTAAVVVGALESEAVLTRERLYLGGSDLENGFRVVFQAFSDFLILRRRLEIAQTMEIEPEFRAWLEKASWGIWEAAAVVLPETLGAEIPDVLAPGDMPSRRSRKWVGERARRANVMRIFVEAIPYRTGRTVTDRTVELLNDALSFVPRNEFYRVTFRIAPLPENRLNGDALDKHLKRMTMPQRDAWFGFATYGEIWDESSPTAMLGRWASNGPYPEYDDAVIELSCIPLIWLFSSPNRFQRDWITKALVQLLSGHLKVAERLIDRFWNVDDPYVIQRVIVVCYGALMRGGQAKRAAARRLVKRVKELVFVPPVRPDELLIDAARGIVEWGIAHDLLPAAAEAEIVRPYGIPPPERPLSDSALKRRYGRYDLPVEKSFSSLYSSVLSMGDFGRYVVEPGVRRFSRYRHGETLPSLEVRPEPNPRLKRPQWVRFVESLSADQTARLEAELRRDGPAPTADEPLLSTLTAEQMDLYRASWSRPRRSYRDDGYPSDRAKRWVLQRAIRLGWRPMVFGREDRFVGQDRRGREAHKAERWGKKYQWMAYHELLARLADNYQGAREWDTFEPYGGLQQIIGDREIDPSVPPIDFRGLGESPAPPTFPSPPIEIPSWPPARVDFARYHGDVERFVADRATEPTLESVIKVQDSRGQTWVVLDAYLPQGDPAEDKYWRGLQQPLSLRTILTPKEDGSSLVNAITSVDRAGPWEISDTQGHTDCCLHLEVGWSPRNCPHFVRDLRPLDWGDKQWRIVSPIEEVTWESGLYDCSTEESVRALLPSTFVQSSSDLRYDVRGPSWVANGETALTNYPSASEERGHAFLAKADWLGALMRRLDMDLVALLWYQRWRVTPDPKAGEPWDEVRAAGRMDPDLRVEEGPVIRDHRQKRSRRRKTPN